ncbi:nuclear transport factor 2 family protein [Pseudomonas iridis]|uniref:Nuclear transport factor 2 family protein n=1 Tax=Pseudomonas iridis TaxID=2710587 RepID=A0ABW8DK34_9PSED
MSTAQFISKWKGKKMRPVFMKVVIAAVLFVLSGGWLSLANADNVKTLPLNTAEDAEKTPRQIVTEFFDLAFVQRHPTVAAMKYISPDKYIQHNPNGMDGRATFIDGFAKYVEKSKYQAVIKRIIAEGEMVVVHSHGFSDPDDSKDRGEASVDIFRVENGKIVEHWDVIQPVPETSKNSNTMF